MFEIKPAYSIGVNGDDLMVVDEERGVWLQRITDVIGENASVLKLVWGERVIPFEVWTEWEWDDLDRVHFIKRFRNFGNSAHAEYRAGITGYRFKDEAERQAALLLAVEAMLAYGSLYNGFKRPDGFNVIELDGRRYISSDFGLPSGPDTPWPVNSKPPTDKKSTA